MSKPETAVTPSSAPDYDELGRLSMSLETWRQVVPESVVWRADWLTAEISKEIAVPLNENVTWMIAINLMAIQDEVADAVSKINKNTIQLFRRPFCFRAPVITSPTAEEIEGVGI